MKDIFSKLKNFLSDPSSTMALIGALMVFVSSFFITPDRFCIVMVSFLAFFAIIAMRVVEMRLTKRVEERDEVIQEKDEELRDLRQDIDGISAACKKKHEDYKDLQAKYDSLLQSMPFEVNHEPKATPVKEPAGRKAKYSKKDIERIREEIRSTSDERDEFAS